MTQQYDWSTPGKWDTYVICVERCGWVTNYAVWGKPLSPRVCPQCGADIHIVVGRWHRRWIRNNWWKRLWNKGFFINEKFEIRINQPTLMRSKGS